MPLVASRPRYVDTNPALDSGVVRLLSANGQRDGVMLANLNIILGFLKEAY